MEKKTIFIQEKAYENMKSISCCEDFCKSVTLHRLERVTSIEVHVNHKKVLTTGGGSSMKFDIATLPVTPWCDIYFFFRGDASNVVAVIEYEIPINGKPRQYCSLARKIRQLNHYEKLRYNPP